MADQIQTAIKHGLALRVVFVRQVDRFTHLIQYVDRNVSQTLFNSVEGTAAELWPPSPVLQQLHIESRAADQRDSPASAACADRHVALLVGMAGRSHWSMSVEADLDALGFTFDVACRVHSGELPQLGSTYQSAVPFSVVDEQKCSVEICPNRFVTIRVELAAQLQRAGEQSLRIAPLRLGDVTARWKYHIELSNP